ncbi:MAG: dienelactone hydrolase family protein [Novosphingobium sp.]
MCDEFTAEAEAAALARAGLSRRAFAASGAAVAIAACSGTPSMAKATPKLSEIVVRIATPDGIADALFVHPAKGRHPAVIMWPDVAGFREAYKEMGRRLAGAGYAVLVVNHYYRSQPAPILSTMAEWRSPAGQDKLKPLIALLTPDGTARDSIAFVAWLDAQRAVDTRRGIGSQGYCQTGSFAMRSAAAAPGRVKAVGSFHGGGLVTDKLDSPHRTFAATQAQYLIAIARNDDARAPTDKDTLKAAAAAAGRPAEIEVYTADHGWCTLDAPIYDKAEADRAWGRLLALYKAAL